MQRGKDYELKRASELLPGDEIAWGINFDSCKRDTVVNVYDDDGGCWVDWESGDCGYIRQGNYRYKVLL